MPSNAIQSTVPLPEPLDHSRLDSAPPTQGIGATPLRGQTDPTGTHSPATTGTIECTWPSCPRSFVSRTVYNHHMKSHSKPFLCSLCTARHATKRHLDRHVNERHQMVEKYYCLVDHCKRSRKSGGSAFPRAENCKRHMIKVHKLNGSQIEDSDLDEETRRIRSVRKGGRKSHK
ncbi:hypothetical protein BKA64DRAFT_267287 [Cadophora sp. MPI-SDFR-AT-0126]|nr:hypothetical protein BKA64DRAFT_267287 [Leotiomycetes sp. MPI-SDFR-AT-0126]